MRPRRRTILERRANEPNLAKPATDSGDAEIMLDVRTVARRLEVGTQPVYRQLHSGMLEGHKIGGQWRVKPSALQKFIEDSIWVPNSRKLPK